MNGRTVRMKALLVLTRILAAAATVSLAASVKYPGKVMRRKLLPLAIATVLACVTAATGLAAGSTQVEHFSFTTPPHYLCGSIFGTAVVHGTSVFRDAGNGTYFMSGTFVGVF